MTTAPLLLRDHGSVRVLTMNRPEARNALNDNLFGALYTAFREAEADESVDTIVLTGTDPAFCAGLDLKAIAREGLSYFERFHAHNCINAAAECGKPIVGAINGATFTGGLELSLACDFLIASPKAVFADTHARVGILPGGGMTARLPQLVGFAMARRLSMTSETIDAARAQQIGLITEIVAHEQLINRAVEIATKIAEVDPATMRGLKAIYTAGAAAIVGPALAAEQRIAGTFFSGTDRAADTPSAVGDRRHMPASRVNPGTKEAESCRSGE